MQITSSIKTRCLNKFRQINQNRIPEVQSGKPQIFQLLTCIHFLNYAVKLTKHFQLQVICCPSIWKPQHTKANWLAAYQNWTHFIFIVLIWKDNYLNIIMSIPLSIVKTMAHLYEWMSLLEYSPILNSF
jgi:hypothetical protein